MTYFCPGWYESVAPVIPRKRASPLSFVATASAPLGRLRLLEDQARAGKPVIRSGIVGARRCGADAEACEQRGARSGKCVYQL